MTKLNLGTKYAAINADMTAYYRGGHKANYPRQWLPIWIEDEYPSFAFDTVDELITVMDEIDLVEGRDYHIVTVTLDLLLRN